MAKTPLERVKQRVPLPPAPSSTSGADGMESAREIARQYLPDLVRLFAAIALAPESEAALHTRMLSGKQLCELAGAIPQAMPEPPLRDSGDDSDPD
jgi:hypothetical protein